MAVDLSVANEPGRIDADVAAVKAARSRIAAIPIPYLRYRLLRARYKAPDRQSAPGRVTPRLDGLLMWTDEADVIDFMLRHFGSWEPQLTAVIRAWLRPGDAAADFGANIGAHTLTMAKAVGPSGAVVAVEPDPDTHRRLTLNLQLNGFGHVSALAAAAGDERGTVKLYTAIDGSRGRQSIEAWVGASTVAAEVPMIPAHAVWDRALWARTRLIKIDVERAEHKVLRGLHPVMATLPDDALLIVEALPQDLAARGTPLDELVAPLVARGFAFHVIDNPIDMRFMMRPKPPAPTRVDPGRHVREAASDFLICRPDVLEAMRAPFAAAM